MNYTNKAGETNSGLKELYNEAGKETEEHEENNKPKKKRVMFHV